VSEHSNLVGGSSAGRAIACPWSIANRHLALPDTGSDFAREGTMLHAVIETFLKDHDGELVDMIGLEVAGVTFTAEHVETVQTALDLFNEYADALEAEELDRPFTFKLEAKVSFGEAIPEAWGTADVVGRCGTVAVVMDWKFGSGVEVQAEGSDQLLFYAAAARRTLPAVFEVATEIGLVIIQPAFGRSVWTVTHAELDAFEHRLVLAIAAAGEENPPVTEGKHCRWCPVKHVCPLKQDTAERALVAATTLADMGPVMLGAWLDKVEQMEDFIRALRDLGHRSASAGQAPVGWKLAPKRATRKWVNESVASDALVALGCSKSELFSAPALISPAQVEKVLKPRKLQIPADLITAVSSGDTLVRDDDPRPAAGNLLAGLRKLAKT
jgi:Protein of unknown function (DUF2800)